MEPGEYKRRIDELSELIGLGKELDVNVSPAETLLRRALEDYSKGRGDAARAKMENGLRYILGAVGPVVERRVLRCRDILDGHSQRGIDVPGARRESDLALEAHREGRLREAHDHRIAAERELDMALSRFRHQALRVRFGEWLLATMAWAQGVDASRGSPARAEAPGQARDQRDGFEGWVDEIQRSAVEVLRDRLPELLDRAQRRVVAMRFKEEDPARPSMDFLTAADYLEMARRRYERGTDEDLMVVLEYIFEVDERSSGAE